MRHLVYNVGTRTRDFYWSNSTYRLGRRQGRDGIGGAGNRAVGLPNCCPDSLRNCARYRDLKVSSGAEIKSRVTRSRHCRRGRHPVQAIAIDHARVRIRLDGIKDSVDVTPRSPKEGRSRDRSSEGRRGQAKQDCDNYLHCSVQKLASRRIVTVPVVPAAARIVNVPAVAALSSTPPVQIAL